MKSLPRGFETHAFRGPSSAKVKKLLFYSLSNSARTDCRSSASASYTCLEPWTGSWSRPEEVCSRRGSAADAKWPGPVNEDCESGINGAGPGLYEESTYVSVHCRRRHGPGALRL